MYHKHINKVSIVVNWYLFKSQNGIEGIHMTTQNIQYQIFESLLKAHLTQSTYTALKYIILKSPGRRPARRGNASNAVATQ